MEAAGAAVAASQRPQRYTELLQTVTAISQKELTRNLRELAAAELLTTDASDKGNTRYSLTPLGTEK